MMKQASKVTVKRDCFAYNSNRNACAILTDTTCQGEECAFYKSRKQLNKEQVEVKKYILSLDQGILDHIVDRYYGGNIERLKRDMK